MDKRILAVEEISRRRSDHSVASSAIPLGSLVQINSIAIDINCAMDKEIIEVSAHDHFSIRGYVAGMRKNDRKMHSNCVSDDDGGNDDSVDNLPPLSVPRFRWWQCSNCVPDIATIGARSSSFENIDGEKDSFFSNGILCTIAGSKEETDVEEDNKVGNRDACIMEANPLLNRDEGDKIADSPLRVEDPENASSGSDNAFSALPYKRKRKLRSLADIMVGEKNSMNDHPPRTRSTDTEAELLDRIKLDVVAKDALSPPKKRKFSLEGPSDTTYPIVTGKRSKGPIPYSDRTCKRVESFDSEREGFVSRQPDLNLDAKRKNKAHDINRKVRQNLQKHADAAETGFCNTGHIIPLTAGGENELYSRSFVSEQPTDRIYNPSKSKRPEVEAGYSPFTSPSITGDCNTRGKMGIGLSGNGYLDAELDRGIPDLNESFIERSSTMQGKQVPHFFKTKISNTVDMSESCNKETVKEGKRQFGFSEPLNMATNREARGSSDEIPMEIVELLAKNQRERALGRPPGNGIINFPFASTSGASVSGSQTGILSYSHSDIGFTSFASVPRSNEGSDLLWPPRSKNVPFQLSATESRAIQHNGHIKGKQKQAGRMRLGHKSSDAYSNDTIPAMQLLSLMDQGIVSTSSSSFKTAPTGFLDKPFPPFNQLKENQNGSIFSQSNFPGLVNGVCFSGQKPPKQGNSTTFIHLDVSKSRLSTEICTVNRNPADFSIPDSRNEFTLTAKDLKRRKKNDWKHVESQKRYLSQQKNALENKRWPV